MWGTDKMLQNFTHAMVRGESVIRTHKHNPDNIQIIRRTKNYRVYWPLAENRKPSTYKDLNSLLTALALRGVTIPEDGPWRNER